MIGTLLSIAFWAVLIGLLLVFGWWWAMGDPMLPARCGLGC